MLLVRHVHVTCVLLSLRLLVPGGGRMRARGTRWRRRCLRILPHVVDAVVLASALVLVVLTRQYPFVQAWPTAKFFALVACIVAGSMAMRAPLPRAARAPWMALALVLSAWAASVAPKHRLWPPGSGGTTVDSRRGRQGTYNIDIFPEPSRP